MECPNLVHKGKTLDKKKFNKNNKGKRAYFAWDENDSTTSSSLKEDEEVNLCLMARDQSKVSSASSNISINHKNYTTLLQAFVETHDEANRLALSNNRLKGLNNWLEERVNTLEEKLKTINSDLEHLNMIYQSSNHERESSKPTKCENYEVLQDKVKCLVKTSSKLAIEIANLNVVPCSQNCVFDKSGIDFKLVFQKKTRRFNNFFNHNKKQASPFHKPVLIVCTKAILLGLVELYFLMFEM